jgi:hypothetical protein
MRFFALLVALLVILIGLVGVVAPDRLIMAGRYMMTPVGLYAVAALRVGMGLVLILVAPTSRAPKALRAIGAVVLVAGLATPLFGVERSRGIAGWAEAQGPAFLRGIAGILIALGSFIAFAVAAGRRSAAHYSRR